MKMFAQLILQVFFLGFIAEWIRSSENTVAKKLRCFKAQWLFIVLIIVLFVRVAYRRNDISGDTGTYLLQFSWFNGKTFKDCWDILDWNENNAFYFISYLIKIWITDQKAEYLKIIAILFYTASVIFIYHYSRCTELAVFMYICGGSFIASVNGMKQYAAAVFILASVWMIYKKMWFLYIPFILVIAMQFHRSTAVFIAIYFICNIDIKSHPKIKKNMPYFILLLGVLLLLSTPVTGHWMSKLVEDTNYGGYSNMLDTGSTSSNPVRILISIIPFALGMAYGKYIEPHEKYYHIFMCMCAFSVVFYTLGIAFVYYARFSIYFNLFTIPLMTWVVRYAPDNDKKILYFLIILFFGLYFYFEMCVSLSWTWDTNWYAINA